MIHMLKKHIRSKKNKTPKVRGGSGRRKTAKNNNSNNNSNNNDQLNDDDLNEFIEEMDDTLDMLKKALKNKNYKYAESNIKELKGNFKYLKKQQRVDKKFLEQKENEFRILSEQLKRALQTKKQQEEKEEADI